MNKPRKIIKCFSGTSKGHLQIVFNTVSGDARRVHVRHVGHSMDRNEGDLLLQRPAHQTFGAGQAPLMARLEARVRVPQVQLNLWVPLIVPGAVKPCKKGTILENRA